MWGYGEAKNFDVKAIFKLSLVVGFWFSAQILNSVIFILEEITFFFFFLSILIIVFFYIKLMLFS